MVCLKNYLEILAIKIIFKTNSAFNIVEFIFIRVIELIISIVINYLVVSEKGIEDMNKLN